jgi:hypothetical protein
MLLNKGNIYDLKGDVTADMHSGDRKTTTAAPERERLFCWVLS